MRVKTLLVSSVVILVTAIAPSLGAANTLNQTIAQRVTAVNDKVVAWRRDIHANPELSNREFRTSALVAQHLRSLGIEVQTGVAHTGVIGLLKGGKPGPVIALRADMDALPVVEKTGLPYASTVRGEYQGRDVGVMHACGHDTHVAILMGAAEVLAAVRDELPGTVKFLFQPAEEGAPKGENGGAKMMIEEGALLNPRVDAVVGLHISQSDVVGRASFRPLGLMASAQRFDVEISGSQTHGARPWAGVDPIVAGAQIVNGLQTIASRQIDITQHPVVVTVGQFEAGVRNNIVPETARLSGTIRTFDPNVRGQVHEKIQRIVTQVAASQGATATVDIDPGVPVTYNHAGLTEQLQGALAAVYGSDNLIVPPPITGAEDFSFFQEQVPGFFFFIGGRPVDVPVSEAIPNHSPYFYVDEGALPLGVHAMSRLAVDYLRAGSN
ncbi:MAG TPA: amidohydrolase [Gammaproteobacteria bacterium]|nr:N-acyl-L-amino acid amidohydrolase [Gammaproteobacteria bacterium]HCG70739.1 amidohydrolase [Gammaproteobacteria bacterium]